MRYIIFKNAWCMETIFLSAFIAAYFMYRMQTEKHLYFRNKKCYN
jgi:hypothetical protein